MKLIETICYECYAGSDFDTFAREVINDVKKHERDSLMAFNGAFIRVNQNSTLESLREEYQKQRKDAFDLIRFREVNVQKTNVMTNEEKSQEISEKYKHYNVECPSLDCYLSAIEMAKYKDSQPQIIEIFGKRVKIINDDYSSAENCKACALLEPCYSSEYTLCQTVDEKFNRHFVEVDEDGNEINQ